MTSMNVPFPERDSEELLTLTETAEILRVPVNTLRWWRQLGTGPCFFKMGRRLVTTVGDVRGYIRQQRLADRPDILPVGRGRRA
ncbi:helix-turn-helix domain-containing protein [Nocardioides sp. NPDC127514]|uniref:helix-turn-helix domain-containing protein n=1 Tax=unclassified Nocardioides TaxID=2615069 RepID=UPI00332B7938